MRVHGERIEVDDIPGFEDWDSVGDGPQEAIGEIAGATLHLKWRADETVIDFLFVEADGTRWTGSAGYLTPYMNDDVEDRDSEGKISKPDANYTPPWAVS